MKKLLIILLLAATQVFGQTSGWNIVFWNGTNLTTRATSGTNIIPVLVAGRRHTLVTTNTTLVVPNVSNSWTYTYNGSGSWRVNLPAITSNDLGMSYTFIKKQGNTNLITVCATNG